MQNLIDRIAMLESLVTQLTNRMSNTVSRGTMTKVADGEGMQAHTVSGYYGEELDKLPVWQPFGLSAHCPPGGDVLLSCIGGNRDGAQVVAVTHPKYRPSSTAEGETVIYDAYGQTALLGENGIKLTDRNGNTVDMTASGVKITDGNGNVVDMAGGGITLKASHVEIKSGSLTHNGTNIGQTHTHGGVTPGLGSTGAPN